MKKVNHKQLTELMKICYKKRINGNGKRKPPMIWGTMGIGKCLEENTLILTNKGEVPLKELNIGDIIIGYNFKTNKTEKAKILNCFQKKDKIIEIGINKDIIIKSSKEHHFYTSEGWKQAKDLKIGDTVYLYGNRELLDRKRITLFDRNNRWRRKSAYDYTKSKKRQNSFGSNIDNIKQFDRINGLVERKIPIKKQEFNKRYEKLQKPKIHTQRTSQNNLSCCNNRKSKNSFSINGNISHINCQKEANRTNFKIHRTKRNKMEKAETNREKIYKRGNSNILGIEKTEFNPVSITKINRKNEKQATLRDITTTTGNYIANRILVHNSQAVKECAKELAKELKLEFSETEIEDGKFGLVDVRLSQLEAVDLRGLPQIANGKTSWILPDFLPRNKNSKGILFFDEFPNSPPSVQHASLQIALDGKIGSYFLPSGWLVVAAGNLDSDKSHGFSLSSPLLNRFLHVELATPSIEQWTSYATEHGFDSRWIAFLNFKPQFLYRFDPKANDKAFPTPRMNEFVCDLISGVEGNYALMETLVASAVGEGVAIEFINWYKLREKIDLDSILEKPEKLAAIKEVSMRYSVVSGLAEKYKGDSKIGDRLFDVCKFVEAEYAVLLLKLMYSVNKTDMQKKMVMGNKKWVEITNKYGKYFDYES